MRKKKLDKDTERLNKLEEEFEQRIQQSFAETPPNPTLDLGYEAAYWVSPECLGPRSHIDVLAHAVVVDAQGEYDQYVCELDCPVSFKIHEGFSRFEKKEILVGYDSLIHITADSQIDIQKVIQGETEKGPLVFIGRLESAPSTDELSYQTGMFGRIELSPHIKNRGFWSASFRTGGSYGARLPWSSGICYKEEDSSLSLQVGELVYSWTNVVFLALDSELSRRLMWQGEDAVWIQGRNHAPHPPVFQGALFKSGDHVRFLDIESGEHLRGTVWDVCCPGKSRGKRQLVYRVAIDNVCYYPDECDIDYPPLSTGRWSDSPFATLELSRPQYSEFIENGCPSDGLLFEITRSDWVLDEEREAYLPHCVLEDVSCFGVSEDETQDYVEFILEDYYNPELPENLRSRQEPGLNGNKYEHYYENFFSIRTFRKIVREAELRLVFLYEAMRKEDIDWLEQQWLSSPYDLKVVQNLRKPGMVTRAILFYERFVELSKKMLKELKGKQACERNKYNYVVRITGP